MTDSENANWYRLFLGFSRRLLFLRYAHPSPLQTNESHAMIEIARRGPLSARHLGELLDIETSSLSRMLKSLTSLGLVQQSTSARDKRWKDLSLTRSGEQTLLQDALARNTWAAFSTFSFGEEDRQFFTKTHAVMSNSIHCPALKQMSEDSSFEVSLRRLNRGTGQLGSNFLDTGRTADACQLIQVLGEHGGSLPLMELGFRLPLERTILSRLVSRLEQDKLLVRTAGSDARMRVVSLSPDGNAAYEKAGIAGGRMLALALQGLSGSEQEHLAKLYAQITPQQIPQLSTHRLTDAQERHRARTFALQQLAVSNRLDQAPAVIAAETSLSVALLFQGDLVALADADAASDELQLTLFVIKPLPEITPLDLELSLLRAFIQVSLQERPQSFLVIRESTLQRGLGSIFSPEALHGPMPVKLLRYLSRAEAMSEKR